MKKMMMVGLLLTVAMALQAQLKVAPKMEKGTVKNYISSIYDKTGIHDRVKLVVALSS